MIAGQAVQPILVMFPLGLFAIAVIFDVANLLGAPAIVGSLAYWNIVAGLVAGVAATIAGAVDLAFVRRPDARRIGVLRVLLNMGVLFLFAVILMVRVGDPDRQAGVGLFLLELLALAISGFGAWFSGELANGRTPAFARAAVGNRGY
ncbi:putative membrane protein [Paractinoplanes brasiliensis]|uniref:Putative membrane protein n=1 Tax=Paractinoplanes brasiliensis TaxID=52695 RepID=A0A4R6JVH4_9ACTN|nr:putative membrane protein [Actinoplanes brasiliensis]